MKYLWPLLLATASPAVAAPGALEPKPASEATAAAQMKVAASLPDDDGAITNTESGFCRQPIRSHHPFCRWQTCLEPGGLWLDARQSASGGEPRAFGVI